MKMKLLPPVDLLRDIFRYDQDTGVLYRKHDTNARWKAGPVKGSIRGTNSERQYVTIDGEGYIVSRVIWKMMTGEDPVGVVDHEDTDSLNNRWTNLRDVTHAQNGQNVSMHVDNVVGMKGVSPTSSGKKYRAQIYHGRRIHIGYFHTPEAAKAAYDAKAIELFGEFARP